MKKHPQENRQIILPNEEKSYNFETNYNYDMLGRMTQITYPDSEIVKYTYNLDQLTSVGDYAQDLQYDDFDKPMSYKLKNNLSNSYT